MFNFFKARKKEHNDIGELDYNNIPQHVAIIMDGNGRWAKQRNMPRTMGHKAGVETIRRIVKEADRLGIKYITLYAFSTENWKRPKDEVNALMKLLVQYLKSEVTELHKNEVVLRVLGDITALQEDCKKEIEESIELTKNNTGLVLNVAFNYGGRDEIIRAVKNIASDVESGKVNKENINQDLFSEYLYTKDSPDPDLIIRPSGEQRISNFLLWQCAYSEFWYSNVNWPDFSENDLQQAIYDYQNRNRRYGGV
ncbi:isoprenyl transferase [Clostridioides difficile]